MSDDLLTWCIDCTRVCGADNPECETCGLCRDCCHQRANTREMELIPTQALNIDASGLAHKL